MIHLPWLWEVRVNSADKQRQRSELRNLLSNRQGKLNEELTKNDTEEKDVDNGGTLWHVGTSRSPREKSKPRSKNVSKSFFWSDLLNELNDKSAPGTSNGVDAHKKSPRADKIASISAEVLLNGYSVSECPFGHRRLVGSHLISKEAINCRHCRYLVALHEQRSRPPQRRQSDTSRSNKMTSSMVLPEIREHKSPECNDSGSATQSPSKSTVQQPASEQPQAASNSAATATATTTATATKAKPNRRRLGNYHKEVQQPSSIPSVHHTVSHIPHLYVSGTTTEISRQEERPLAQTSTQAKTAKNQSRTVETTQPSKINNPTNGNCNGNGNNSSSGSGSGSGTTMTSCKADRIIIVDDMDVETRVAKKEPPFYSIFANPFEAGLPGVVKERLVEMQRLETATVRREREEEARRRMKRARKHRAATTDDAEDDDVLIT